MVTYLAQVTIPYFTGIPTDVITNTWHFERLVGTPGTTEYNNLRDNLIAFYNSVYDDGGAGTFWAPWVDPQLSTVKVYNLAEPAPRAPKYEAAMALDPPTLTGSGIPPEVAVVMSYQANTASGSPQARRRGRIFLGGWGSLDDPGDATQFPAVASTLRTSIGTAADTLNGAMSADSWFWVVYSRVGAMVNSVTNGWVDDAFDTQRRRGNAPTTRTLWS